MINYITTPFKWFFKLEAASGLLLLFAAIIALILSNSTLSTYYFYVLNTNLLIGAKGFGLELHKTLFSEVKNFPDMPNYIVASSTTVPSDLSPSAITIVDAPPLAITPAGVHPYPEYKNRSPTININALIIFKF